MLQVDFFKIISILIVAFSIQSCAGLLETNYTEAARPKYKNYKRSSEDMKPNDGRCYARCLIPDEFETFEEKLPLYIGSDVHRKGVELETIILEPADSEWEKKKKEDCQSVDSLDCMLWCLIKYPEVSEDFYIVTDTNLVKEYYWETITITELVREGGFTEWKEVICQDDITPDFYKRLQLALMEKGNLNQKEPDGKISIETKEALLSYQRANGLPVGSLDYETLSHLGVEY